MSQVIAPTPSERARDALRRHAWGEAYELLAGADAEGRLDAAELLLLADAAWWVGKLPAAIDAQERAFAMAQQAGQPELAVVAAIQLGRNNVLRNRHPVATAWLNRAERLLEHRPDNPGHGWLAVVRAFQAGMAGPIDTVLAQADMASAVAKRVNDPNLTAMAMVCQGLGLVMAGRAEEGMALLDEATVAAVGGELNPDTAGSVCCATIGACTSLGDLGRATQWTEAQDRWCEREHINGYPGMCRLYRSEIKSLQGAWLEAEAEARRASEELQGFIPAAAGLARYLVGELRLRRGDLPAAEESLLAAHAMGSAEPALSLLRLAQGRTAEAFEGMRRALDGVDLAPSWLATPNSTIARTTLLPAMVEIALAAGDRDAATAAAVELEAIASQIRTPVIEAKAATSSAVVALAGGDVAAAIDAARRGIKAWREVEAPWELARARTVLGEALAADDATGPAILELRAARATFEELEALLDVRRVDALLARLGAAEGSGPGTVTQRVLRTFVFTDIVDSTRLAEALGDETWDGLLRSHDRVVRGALARHGGEEIKRTGDGFFVAFDDPDRAIEFGVEVQRSLATSTADSPEPLRVRIGMHRAEANRSGMDYIGTGVNVAARVSAAAEADEILVSNATLLAARRTWPDADRRLVSLRGVAQDVELVAIAWR